LAQDPRLLGGQLGMLGVVQTWTRDLRDHPHIHYLVPGGALASDGRRWVTTKADFLVHVKPLAALFRAKLRATLRQTELWADIPDEVWHQDWVVDCRAVGSGRTALTYLAPYVFRVALSNNRLLGIQDGQVTFRYQDGTTRQTKTCTLPAEAFITRFLQHILPKGFVKVRYYGLFRVGHRRQLARLQAQLILQQRKAELLSPSDVPAAPAPALVPICPTCGHEMRLERILTAQRAPPVGRCVA
jgi:putative transposase